MPLVLAQKEAEIAIELLTSSSMKEIAVRLSTTEQNVKNIAHRIYKKRGYHSRIDLLVSKIRELQEELKKNTDSNS